MNPYFDFPLKEQQENAFKALLNFCQNPEHKFFVLRGYAGTGKTTLMGGLIKFLGAQKITFKLIATTGRAAKILREKTGSPTKTIHGLIYSFLDLDSDLESFHAQESVYSKDHKGQLSLIFDLRPIKSETETIYIIDETSMISDQPDQSTSFAKYGSGDLLNDLYNYDSKARIIMVGDPCQLPPMNQGFSPALNKLYLEKKFGVKSLDFELTQIARQKKDNGIINASLQIRRLFHENPEVKFAKIPLKGHKNIVLLGSHAILINEFIHAIKKNGVKETTMICQLNRHCKAINEIIRNSLFSNPGKLCVGDLLLVTQNSYLTNLVNGDQVEVLAIGGREFRCGLTFTRVSVKEITSSHEYNILLIENILDANGTNLDNIQNKDLIIDFYIRMKDKGIKQKDERFKEEMLKDPYLNALRAVYGFAITCHKSQGGEWENVFLYLDNSIHGIKKPGIYQWWYTAVTRAKSNLYATMDWFVN